MFPEARRDGVLTKDIDGELILYDQERQVAHRLNATAAVVWQQSDGTRTEAELAEIIHGHLGEAVDEALVHLALARLSEAGLLHEPARGSGSDVQLTRRAAVQRIARTAAVAALLPVVTSVVAPTPADAQSGRGKQNDGKARGRTKDRSKQNKEKKEKGEKKEKKK